MTGHRRPALAARFALAAVGVGALAILLIGCSGPPAPTGAPVTSPATSPAGTSLATSSPSIPPASPSAEPSAPPTQTPTLTPTNAPVAATMLFTKLKLDPQNDPAGQDRVITFTSQGSGQVTAVLTSLTPQGTTRMCLSTPAKSLGCTSTATGLLTATTTAPTADFTLTLRGEQIDAPVVQVAVTFPAVHASVTIANARFDGTAFPDTNGIEALLTPRASGDVRLQAEWGGHPLQYDIHLADQGGTGNQEVTGGDSATGVDTTLPVSAPNPWLLTLVNTESGFGVTGLTATISWP